MNLADYHGIWILLGIGLAIGIGAVVATHIFASKRFYPNKLNPYECGIPTEGVGSTRFSVKFYLVAVSFILFDIETIFMIPWALSFRDYVDSGNGPYIFVVGAIFLFILTLGLVYEWRRGLLDWNK
ncbi:MAG: NADH-quinone oxidoreductase subunit A [Bradymonadales bacterium]|nr:MAG: NADH-quinone oxidoreductase subunit A [Bradymonadales bacterium]